MGKMMEAVHSDGLHPAVLEPEFMAMLDQICALEGLTCSEVVADINEMCGKRKLAAAIRVFILEYYVARA